MPFDARVHDKWPYEKLPMVQRIMNTGENTSAEIIPAELFLNNSIRLSARFVAPPGSNIPTNQVALSVTLDNSVAREHSSSGTPATNS